MPDGAAGGAQTRDEAVRRASADAATRAGVPADRVRTVQAADRDWSDGSMGCPSRGAPTSRSSSPATSSSWTRTGGA